MPESELIDTIKGVFKPTPKMLLGIAFGRCLEKPDKYRWQDSDEHGVIFSGYRVPVKNAEDKWESFYFTDSLMDICLARFDRNGVFEVKGTRQYGDITVVAKADQILGTRIVENKTKVDGQFDFDRYAASVQWRFEFDIFQGSTALTYNVFMLDHDDKAGETFLKSIETFDVYPYPQLHQDCTKLVEEFRRYVHQRRLTEYLQENEYARAQIR